LSTHEDSEEKRLKTADDDILQEDSQDSVASKSKPAKITESAKGLK